METYQRILRRNRELLQGIVDPHSWIDRFPKMVWARSQMSLHIIPKADWAFEKTDKEDPEVKVKCPSCSEWYLLNHTIDTQGLVVPSLSCPTRGCGYHSFVKLEKWDPTKRYS